MATNYLRTALNVHETPQSEPIPGSDQVQNNAGGYAFAVDDWMRLRRWLILGSEGGTYYVDERKLTKQNTDTVLRCVKADGVRTVNEIVAISDAGRAPKNDPALLALAVAARMGDEVTRKAAFAALPKVARIGTHLFHFVQFMEQVGGWGRLARRGVAAWYEDRGLANLAEQAVKYQSRDGWGHKDLIRLSHPQANDLGRTALFRYMSYGTDPDGEHRGEKVKKFIAEEDFHRTLATTPELAIVRAFEQAKTATTEAEIVSLITDHQLPRECIPTQWLKSPKVWEALLPHMGITALIRNLASMTSNGLIAPGSAATATVLDKLGNMETLRRGRVHPIAILVAMLTYKSGHGQKGSLTWTPVTPVIDALDRAFYLAFGNVEPSNKAWEMWLDVSGSMGMGTVGGVAGFTPRVASAAFALVNANVERQCEFYAFATNVTKLSISPRQRLDDVIKTVSGLPFGGTDCSLPMLDALKHKRNVDVFCVLTDSETWAGREMHPVQALAKYRKAINPNAKLIVVGMTATEVSIADPKDPGTLDVVGFDSAAPAIMSEFAAGRL